MICSNILEEGLRPGDLDELVDSTVEIDTYRSKMGEDEDVCVVTFRVKDRSPAKDLMEFIEKGFSFVLDSDISSGENDAGEYFVFVEFRRRSSLVDQITDVIYGVRRLTNIRDWSFVYYKESTKHDLDRKNLEQHVPASPGAYKKMLAEVKTRHFKSFFSKTLMDDFEYEDGVITIYKPFDKVYKFEVLVDGSKDDIEHEYGRAPVDLDTKTVGETVWMTKVFGDYNINKIKDVFIFENQGRFLALKRLPQ